MIALLCFFLTLFASPFKSKSRLEAENAALRHQVIVLQRRVSGRVQLTNGDRLFLVMLYRCCWRQGIMLCLVLWRGQKKQGFENPTPHALAYGAGNSSSFLPIARYTRRPIHSFIAASSVGKAQVLTPVSAPVYRIG